MKYGSRRQRGAHGGTVAAAHPVEKQADGLLHGFGFAGALRDIGLPDDNLWIALLSFNVGIELGQLLLVMIWGALGWLAIRLLPMQTLGPRIQTVTAYAIGGMAIYWTLQRITPLFESSLTLT